MILRTCRFETHVGQWGTHVDPPAHFVKGLRTVDLDSKEMILPVVVH
jgi:kynurenine formamidase